MSAYDVELVDEAKGIPVMDRTKPTLGVMDTVRDEDLLVWVRPRQA